MEKTKDKTSPDNIVRQALLDAVSYVESEIAPQRLKAQKYYDGKVDIGHETGRSKAVSTKVRDVVRATKPSLMRVFLSTARPVEFIPTSQEMVRQAEQATDFISYEFDRLGGFKILTDVFHDALVKKQGIAKAYWCDVDKVETFTYDNVTDEEYAFIVDADGVEVIEHTETIKVEIDEFGVEVERPSHDLKVSKVTTKGEMKIESIPPEEFYVSECRSFSDADVVAHITDLPVSEVIAMGFDEDEVLGLDRDSTGDEEEDQRAEDTSQEGEAADPMMRRVTIADAYMKIDMNGSGIPTLHRFICGGSNYKVLDVEECDELPFAKFEVDPEPHTFYGKSLAELVLEDQDTATAVLRGILDNVYMVNNPRTEVLEGKVNMDDALNNEIGGLVRVTQQGALQPLAVPFVAGQTLSALSYVDDMTQAKTGVSRASMGLNDDALQSTTRVQAQATVQAGAATTESMVRNLAMGVRDLFGIMLRIYQKNSDEEQIMRLGGSFVPVDPRVWDASMDATINVGLGTGREEEKMQGLQMALGLQQQVMAQMGAGNGVVTLDNIRNTISDMLALNGIRNAERYFPPIDPQLEQRMAKQAEQAAQQAQQGMPDPSQSIIAAEQIKGQVKMQSDNQKAQLDEAKAVAEHERKMVEMAAKDDLKRDEMDQDFILKNTELQAKYGIKADEIMLKAEQNSPRDFGGSNV